MSLKMSVQTIRLREAVYERDMNVVRAMLESGLADINNKNGDSLVYIAVLTRNIAMLKLLLNFEPDLSSTDESTCSPTWLAAHEGEDEMVTLLVQAGADVNEHLSVISFEDGLYPERRGMTLLHLAVEQRNITRITLLLDHGADIDALDKNHVTPLQAALQLRNSEISKLLLEKGASVDTANIRGETILQTALLFGDSEILSIILDRKPALNVIDCNGKNAVHYLAESNVEDLQIARRLLNEGAFINQADTLCNTTPLHVALMSDKQSLITLFLEHGADINLSMKYGYTALYLAVLHCSPRVALQLLIKGANPNSVTDDTGETALHIVCMKNCAVRIDALLEHGADINIKAKSGKTAIEYLLDFVTQGVSYLIEHIAKLESFNQFVDERILHFIEKHGGLMKAYHDSCLHELESMKNLKFYNNFSFNYVLKISIEALSKLTANEEFTENFNLFYVKGMFPSYGVELKNKFNNAVHRMISYKNMTKHLSLVFYHKYDSVLEFIVKYLKPTDLPLSLE